MDSFSHSCLNICAIIAAAPGWAASLIAIRLEVSKNLIQGKEVKAVYGISTLISDSMEVIVKALRSPSEQKKKKPKQSNSSWTPISYPVTVFSCVGEQQAKHKQLDNKTWKTSNCFLQEMAPILLY